MWLWMAFWKRDLFTKLAIKCPYLIRIQVSVKVIK